MFGQFADGRNGHQRRLCREEGPDLGHLRVVKPRWLLLGGQVMPVFQQLHYSYSPIAARMPSHSRSLAPRAVLMVVTHSSHLLSSSPHRSASICIAIGVCSSLSTWMWRDR